MPAGGKYELIVLVPQKIIVYTVNKSEAANRAKALTAKMTMEKGVRCTLHSIQHIPEAITS